MNYYSSETFIISKLLYFPQIHPISLAINLERRDKIISIDCNVLGHLSDRDISLFNNGHP